MGSPFRTSVNDHAVPRPEVDRAPRLSRRRFSEGRFPRGWSSWAISYAPDVQVVIRAGATIEVGARIGGNATIEESVAVRAEARIGEGATFGCYATADSGCSIGEAAVVGDFVSRGANATVESECDVVMGADPHGKPMLAPGQTAEGPKYEARGADEPRRAFVRPERAGGRRHRHPGGVPHRPRRGRRTRREAGDRGHRSKPAQRYAQEHESSATAACRPGRR